MTRRILIAGNWKMNMLREDGLKLAETVADRLKQVASPKADVLVCPPFTILSHVGAKIDGSNVKLGAQDCHFNDSGAHTGDISPAMLKDVGCEYVILGHSERRADHNEPSALVKKKAEAAIKHGLKVIICVGESEKQRESGETVKVVNKQIGESMPAGATAENTVIAYEPIWAIGTGKSATTGDVAEVHKAVRAEISKLLGASIASGMKILYGGSVKSSNAKELLALEDVDGALIGGASLKADEFWSIASNCL